jgi:HNH endonuclease
VNTLYASVAERAAHRCEYCRAPEILFNFPFEVEHIMPQAHGGTDDLDNLALACHACNLFNSDFETGPDTEGQAEAILFNPRHDVWEHHFRLDAESGAIAGITPNGRATVAHLRLNGARHTVARRRWVELGLFP